MVGHGGSSAGSYLTDPTSPIPSHCALIVMTSTLRVNDTVCWDQQRDAVEAYVIVKNLAWSHEPHQALISRSGFRTPIAWRIGSINMSGNLLNVY